MVLTRAQARAQAAARSQAAAQDDVEIDGDIDDGEIHDAAADGEIGAAGDDAKKDVDRRINTLQSKESQSGDDAVRHEGGPAEQPEASQYSIEHSLQSAVDAICKTIKEGVRELTPVDERQRIRTTRYEPDWSSDSDSGSDSDGDSEFEMRMLEAWEKSYRHAPRPVSPVQLPIRESRRPSNLDDESKVHAALERDQPHMVAIVHITLASIAATQTEDQSPQTLQGASSPLTTSPERCISNRVAVVRPTAAVVAGTRASSQT
ncbi:hypothetical protein KRP22_014790 [Phytophthora ramorum]|nr:hypothetical protein KRP22_14567 [Phytophthora ramorum]